jgi:DNA topoisomerase I
MLDGHYTLIVTEKPDAAHRIATALDVSGKPKRATENGVPYYEAHRDGKIVVVPALGHLYTVSAKRETRGQFPVFGYEWVPRYQAERGASRIRVWLRVISELAKGADAFVDACDYDLEGSIIGYCILKYACNGKETTAKRMKYSTLTDEELQESYAAPTPHLDFALIDAGLTRHEVDWLYGINLSRALTAAAKTYGKQYATLSTGRVQGPTLKFLATRERSIQRFVPTSYWSIKAKVKIGNAVFEVEHQKKTFATREEAQAVVDYCKTKTGTVKNVQARDFPLAPPLPFDLGTLQSEAYRVFGYTPMRTLSVAQRLYLDALISYPRTSSQRLPPQIGYQKILKALAKNRELTALAGSLLAKPSLRPTEGKKQDSAHPAIYPTGKLPIKVLTTMEKNVYSLIVHRFLACFGDAALLRTVQVDLKVAEQGFSFKATQTLEDGWLRLYEPFARVRNQALPNVSIGNSVRLQKVSVEDKFTSPPARYNPASVLRKMEQGNLGTKATRASTIQTLYDRGYIRGERIAVSDLGIEVTDVLRKFCPTVVSVDFTRQLEERMTQIQQGQETREEVVAQAVEALKPVLASLEQNEEAVGTQLSRAILEAKLEERTICSCPTCQGGKLIIQQSKKSGKRFVGCTNYFNGTCKTAFPLPQNGYVKPSGRACKGCDWKTVTVWLKGKRPWNLCINPQCSTKKKQKKR